MIEKEFLNRIKEKGGTAYLVGGAVRDMIMSRASNDRDYVITGFTEEKLFSLFPGSRRVGKSFPVYLIEISGEKCEVSLARRESKQGHGYNGFSVSFTPDITIEEDLFRRDTTMNAIAYNPLTEEYVDPYDGCEDIQKKLVRAVSEHFTEDPVRALRAARQAAQFGFDIERTTLAYMKECKEELKAEPSERIVAETARALSCTRPSGFFRNLERAGLLEVIYPSLHRLMGKIQPPEYHPEGDAFEHTMRVLDEVALATERPEVRFAALMHDIGKSVTPEEELPHHYGHEKKGLSVLSEINSVMRFPSLWMDCAEFVIKEHMRANRLEKASKITELVVALSKHPIGAEGFISIVRADNNSTLADYLEYYGLYLSAVNSVSTSDIPEALTGAEIGRWLSERKTEAVAELIKKRRS